MINDPSVFKNRKSRVARNSLAKHDSVHAEGNGVIRRLDFPSRVLLPDPHFDGTQNENILRYLATANSRLRNKSTPDRMIGQTLREIYGVLLSSRINSSKAEWKKFIGQIREQNVLEILHEDPFTRRAFDKPRGYAGDAVLMDYIYGREEGRTIPFASLLGQRIFRHTTRSSACQAVAARRGFIADFIDDMARQKPDLSILSLAAGHLREIDISSAARRRQIEKIVAIDSDSESLDEVMESYSHCNVECIHATARQLMSGKVDTDCFDFIYSTGLYDYLSNGIGTKLTTRLFSKLNPGGFLLLTNFLPNIEGVGYMEAFMDWNLIYRNRCEMIQLTEDIPECEVAQVSAFAEEQYNIVFCLIERRR